MTGEFSVHQFFSDGTSERVRHLVDAEEAVEAARHYCYSPAARLGITVRVIIVDALDCCNFEWIRGKGVVYPPRKEH